MRSSVESIATSPFFQVIIVATVLFCIFSFILFIMKKRIGELYKPHDILEGVAIFILSTFVFLVVIALIFGIDLYPGEENTGNLGGLGFLIVGMVAVPATAVLTLWRSRIADKQADAAHKQADIDRERNRADALAKASDLLGNNAVAVQQSGLFALGRLAKASEEDQPTIMKVVAGFIRYHAPKDSAPNDSVSGRAVGIEAATTVLRDRNLTHDTELDILVKRKDGKLEKKEWRFDLSNIVLENIDFTGADMTAVNMSDSVFKRCIFERANFSEASLTGAGLNDSDLTGVNFNNTDLTEANLTGANLTKADLSLARGLTQKQVNCAKGDSETQLPEDIERPRSWE